MAMNWPTFFTRLGSAIVFCIIMLTGLLWHHVANLVLLVVGSSMVVDAKWDIVAFIVLLSFIQAFCLRDYFRLARKINPDTHQHKWIAVFIQLTSLGFLWCTWIFGTANSLPVLICLLVFILLSSVLSRRIGWESGLESMSGVIYITLPIMALMGLFAINPIIPIALILMIWMNDTMAYIVGSFIGKRPFSEISPKKTWEGTIGGVILTIASAALWGYYSYDYHMVDWMVLALCASIAGTAGDLLESKLKRMANVKDSGTLMPGHGGALDRFDSLLVAAPFAFCYAHFCMPPLA